MNRLHSFVIFLIAFGIAGCDKEKFKVQCLPEHLQNGVIAYYPFENGDLVDASGHGNDLTNPTTAHPASDRDDNPQCAYEFDNYPVQGQFLITQATGFLNGQDAFSISVWYQPLDVNASVGQIQGLVSRGDQNRCPDRKGEWSVSLYDCRRAVFGHNNSVWANSVTGTSNCDEHIIAVTDKWHHVVGVYHDDTYKIYYNGILHETTSGPAGCTNLHFAQDIGDLFIGDDFTGRIDDILIYDREITAQEVMDLFEAEPCCN
jgi:hypothetical protein